MDSSSPALTTTTRPWSGAALAGWGMVAAFGTYFCMYAFRKPFTAASYSGESLWGIDYKTVLVASQVLGYTVSKFIGIKVISEMTPSRRGVGLLVLIGAAELALLLFALVPPPYNFVRLFLNGLPLGMVFGLVLGFLEGRCLTEALIAGLCASFVLADGVTKTIGAWLLERGVDAYWMPFTAGLLFLGPLVVFVAMLTRIPPPSGDDVAHRRERPPLDRAARWNFFSHHAAGLTLLAAVYLLVTILRSFRADYAPEIWNWLGVSNQASIFVQSELFVTLGVLAASGCTVYIRDNRRAFLAAMATAMAGLILITFTLAGLQTGAVGGFTFMVLLGLGLYLPYVAMHTTILERLVAMTHDRGNMGYLMYLVDAFGYLGYVAAIFSKGLLAADDRFFAFFPIACWTITLLAIACLALGWRYFAKGSAPQPE